MALNDVGYRRKAPDSVLLILSVLLVFCGLEPGAVQAEQAQEGTRLFDPPRASRPLRLDAAIRMALENNPEIRAGEQEAKAAGARLDAALSSRWPSVHAGGDYLLSQDELRLIPARGNGEPGVFGHHLAQVDLSLQAPLFTGGRITRGIQAAERLQRAAEHRLARSREELVFAVAGAFYGLLGQRHLVASLEFSQQALQEHQRQTQQLLAVQKAARVDLLRTQVRLADIQQRLVSEQNALTIQERLLADLLGFADGTAFPGVEGELEVEPVDADLDSCLSRAEVRRADYLAAQAALQAQQRRVEVARAAYWPVLSARVSYGVRWAPGAAEAPAGAGTVERVGAAGVSIDLPLFDRGGTAARVREEQAGLEAARQRLEALKRQLRLEVETALLSVTSTRLRVQVLEASIDQARESLRIEREKYELGKGAVLDVLDAQAALLEAQTNYYRALVGYNISVARLRLVIGEEP